MKRHTLCYHHIADNYGTNDYLYVELEVSCRMVLPFALAFGFFGARCVCVGWSIGHRTFSAKHRTSTSKDITEPF
jgi:hypothetical protein